MINSIFLRGKADRCWLESCTLHKFQRNGYRKKVCLYRAKEALDWRARLSFIGAWSYPHRYNRSNEGYLYSRTAYRKINGAQISFLNWWWWWCLDLYSNTELLKVIIDIQKEWELLIRCIVKALCTYASLLCLLSLRIWRRNGTWVNFQECYLWYLCLMFHNSNRKFSCWNRQVKGNILQT